MSITILCRHFCFSNACTWFVPCKLKIAISLESGCRQTDTQLCFPCVFHVLLTGDKDLKSENAKDKSHTERCMLLFMYVDTCSEEGGRWALFLVFPHLTAKDYLYILTVTRCPWIIWEQIKRRMIMYNRATSFQSLISDSTHTLKIPLWAWCTSSFKSRYCPMHDYVSSFLVRRWVDVYLGWPVMLWIVSTDVRFYITP